MNTTTNETDNSKEGLLKRLEVVLGALYTAHEMSRVEISDLVEDILDHEADKGEEPDEPDDGMSDVEADADTLRSCGWGTDEDYYHDTPMGEEYGNGFDNE